MEEDIKLHGIGGISHDGRDNGAEFYSTPQKTTEALFDVEEIDPWIWEPCCGSGAISKVLTHYGAKVVSTDLYERGYGLSGLDFLAFPNALAPTIITNPPFSLANDFVKHALEIGVNKIIILHKLQFLEGKARKPLLERHLARVHVFSQRQTLRNELSEEALKSKNGGMMAFAWFTFLRAKHQPTTIDWI